MNRVHILSLKPQFFSFIFHYMLNAVPRPMNDLTHTSKSPRIYLRYSQRML